MLGEEVDQSQVNATELMLKMEETIEEVWYWISVILQNSPCITYTLMLLGGAHVRWRSPRSNVSESKASCERDMEASEVLLRPTKSRADCNTHRVLQGEKSGVSEQLLASNDNYYDE